MAEEVQSLLRASRTPTRRPPRLIRSTTVLIAVVVVLSTVAGAATVAAFAAFSDSLANLSQHSTSPGGGSGFSAFTESVGTGVKATCHSVATCSISITPTANSEVVFVIGFYGTATGLTVGTNKIATGTPALLVASSATAPETWIYAAQTSSDAAATLFYANVTVAGYYNLEAVDLSNVVLTVVSTSGNGTSGGTSTSAACSGLTTNFANEEVISVVNAQAAETITAGGTLIDKQATTTSIATTQDEYKLVTTAGSYTPTDGLSASAAWNMVCVGFIPASVPVAPTGLTAGTATAVTIPVTWTDSSPGGLTAGEVYAAVYASGACGAYSAAGAAVSPFTSATASGLVEGDSYCLEVTVSNGTGASAYSTPITGIATAHGPLAPSAFTATPQRSSTTEIVLSWTNPPGAIVNYTLGSFAGSTCAGTRTGTSITGVTNIYGVTGLTTGTTYSFQIAAYNSTGVGTQSACVSATTYAAPGAPSGLSTTSQTATTVGLAWTQPSGSVVNDTIDLGTTCGTWTSLLSVGDAAMYTVAHLNPYTSYCFAVQAWTAGGQGPASATLTVVTSTNLPPAPTVLYASGFTGTTISLAWTNPSTADGPLVNGTVYYSVTCGSTSGNGSGTWPNDGLSTGGAYNTYTVTGLTPQTSYCLSVTVWTSDGQGGQSNTVTVTTLTPSPGAPTALTYDSASHSSVTVNWTNPVGTLVNDTLAYGTTSGCAGSLHSFQPAERRKARPSRG